MRPYSHTFHPFSACLELKFVHPASSPPLPSLSFSYLLNPAPLLLFPPSHLATSSILPPLLLFPHSTSSILPPLLLFPPSTSSILPPLLLFPPSTSSILPPSPPLPSLSFSYVYLLNPAPSPPLPFLSFTS